MKSATKSLNKFKAARQDASNWSLVDADNAEIARGTSKVFPTRLNTYDPHSFKDVSASYAAPVTSTHLN